MRHMAAVVDSQNAGDPPFGRWRQTPTALRSRQPARWCSELYPAGWLPSRCCACYRQIAKGSGHDPRSAPQAG